MKNHMPPAPWPQLLLMLIICTAVLVFLCLAILGPGEMELIQIVPALLLF